MDRYSDQFRGLWSRGHLTWKEIAIGLWKRSQDHGLLNRAGLLSFYFLLAFFPFLLTLSSLIGFLLSSQTDAYWRLLNYILKFMPPSAFALFTTAINQIRAGASGGKVSFGLLISLWSASSGIAALIEALNIAFAVQSNRKWWRRRMVAIGLTLGIGVLLTASLAILFASSNVGRLLSARLPILNSFSRLSGVASRIPCVALVFGSLILIYSFGPNIHRKHWRGILPGAALALAGGVLASLILRTYLAYFGSLGRSYGSLAGVIALMFWLYASAAAVLLGGELNALILDACSEQAAPEQGLTEIRNQG